MGVLGGLSTLPAVRKALAMAPGQLVEGFRKVQGTVSVNGAPAQVDSLVFPGVIALFSVKTSSIPPDKNHPFGHGKIENISGTIEGLLIFLAAGWVIFEAIKKLMQPTPLETLGWGVGVMLMSCLVNIVVSERLFKVGKETDSVALEADAWHLELTSIHPPGSWAALLLSGLETCFFQNMP